MLPAASTRCLYCAADPCFACLFFPVAHDSFLNHMLGVPWQNAIKYHRWVPLHMPCSCCCGITPGAGMVLIYLRMKCESVPDVTRMLLSTDARAVRGA